MTILEKWRMDHPDMKGFDVVRERCPDEEYPYIPRIDGCKHVECHVCEKCWNREIQEFWDEEKQEIVTEPHIKDSGDRTEFETGAVRDMREGKGRCDLMPLDVAGEWLKDDILGCISQFQTHGTTVFLYGALNYFLDEVGWSYAEALLEVAKHFEEGAKKYGPDNWRMGIDVYCYIDSAVRHYLKWLRGDKDEPHDRAFTWNLLCAIWTCEHKPELNSYAKEE